MEKIEKFLLDSELNDQIFEADYYDLKIHKEKYDDRFYIIYTKRSSEYLLSEDYAVSGYLDVLDKKIYSTTYGFSKVINNTNIKIESFEDLKDEIMDKLNERIELYTFNKQKDLMIFAKEEIDNMSIYRINEVKETVNRLFIEADNDKLKLNKIYYYHSIFENDKYRKLNGYINYINNPEKELKECFDEIISDDSLKKEMGINIYLYKEGIKYQRDLLKNINHQYDYLYINREIYKGLKEVQEAVNINITINYGGNEYTFKFRKNYFENSILRGEKSLCDYKPSYESVSDFIKRNCGDEESRNRTYDFDFSHITSITYGKRVLYQKKDRIINNTILRKNNINER
ncbi:MAG: hypothetical protein IJ105_04205 [Bacilli bacterium]|nr:hypothetical protein [Bacilli bacterium]